MRKVSVGLVADVADFIKFMGSAKKSVDDLGDKVDGLDHSLNKIPPDAAKAGAALKLLDGDVNSVGQTVNNLGEKNTGLAVLDAKIKASRAEVRKLADEFVKTGDIEVFKKLGNAEGLLSSLQTVRKKLADAVVEGPKEAVGDPLLRLLKKASSTVTDWAKSVGDTVGKMVPQFLKTGFAALDLGDLKTIGVTAGIVIAAAAAPLIGAGIGGALLAGAAAGPLVTGIMTALNDPRVEAETDKFGLRLSDTMQRSATYFVPAVQRSVEMLSQSWERLAPQVEMAFVNASPLVEKLTKGVAELAESAMPGFVKATAAAGPVFDQIENTLHAIGVEVGNLFDMLSQHSNEAASGVQAFGMLASGSIAVVSSALESLLNAWAKFVGYGESMAMAGYKWFGWVPLIGEHFRKMWDVFDMLNDTAQGKGATAMQHYGRTLSGVDDSAGRAEERVARLKERSELLAGSLGNAADKAGGLKQALDQLNGTAISAEQAELQYQEAIDKATESAKENGKNLDANTDKGRANREALLALVTATEAKVDAVYKDTLASQGQAAADAAATKAAQDGRKAVIDAAMAMGYSRQAAEEYANKLLKIPGQVDTKFKLYGTDDAEAQIQAIKDSLNRVPGSKTINITVKADLPSGISMGNLMHRASGGPVKAGTPYVVGDGGQPEVFVPDVNGTIVPSVGQFAGMRSSADMRSAGQMGWSGPAGVSITLYGGDDLTNAMLKDIRTEVRTNFGGNVQAALGR